MRTTTSTSVIQRKLGLWYCFTNGLKKWHFEPGKLGKNELKSHILNMQIPVNIQIYPKLGSNYQLSK
jgi:hypothetical protein